MRNLFSRDPGRMWSLGWVIIIRIILYLVIVGFMLQYIYFGDTGRIYRPHEAVAILFAAFTTTLFILTLGSESGFLDQLIAITYVIDLLVLTRVILISGGFNSVFIPYYLPILVMAPAWLPRHFTAIFPSIATLGAAYIGLAHLLVSLDERDLLVDVYPDGALNLLRQTPAHTIVSNMLILAVLFFVVSYLSGILSNKLMLEQRLNAEVLSSMTEGVAVVNGKGQLSYANAEFYRLCPDAVQGRDFRPVAEELLEPLGDDTTLDSLLRERLSNAIIINRDGDSVSDRPPMETRIAGIALRGGGEVFGLLFMVTDLTLRRRMEEAERSVARFAAISTMSAGLAHEIRNPLASLRSAIQEIGSSFPPESQNRTLADIVIAESDRLDRIISRFLDFSREGELRLSRVRLGGVLEEILTMIRHDKTGAEMRTSLSIQDDPPVLCDADRVREVFINLALNASQVTPRGSGRLEVVLRAAKREHVPGMEALFIDNGPGISAAAMPRIFDPFYSNREGGTGMGLSLSRKQVSMHGGGIEASNNDGGGACFRVWLPLEAIVPTGTKARRPGSYTEAFRKLSL